MDLLLTDPASIRTFSRMIHCAAKLGDHLMLSPQPPSTLTLRVINPSQSTFAHFRCHGPFFASTSLTRASPSAKLSTRSLQPLFRAPHSIATLRLAASAPDPTTVLFELKSRSAVIKRFRVPVVSGRIGLTAFDKRAVTCMLQARSRLFLDVLAHFHVRLDEVTFAPAPAAMRVASYVDDVSNPANVMLRTEVTLDTREFEVYTFAKDRPVLLTIFCKYLRAVLDFCDQFDVPVRMWYEAAGHPVLFELTAEGTAAEPPFDVQFIFASRHAEDEHAQRLSPQATPRATHTFRPGSAPRRLRTHTPLQAGRQPSAPVSSAEPFQAVQDANIFQVNPRHLSQSEARYEPSDELEPALPRQPLVSLPPSKRPMRSVFDDERADEEHQDDDDDDDFVEGTPPP